MVVFAAARKKISYGHMIVAVSFLTLAIGGIMGSAFSIFYVALMEEFGWSRSNTALAYSLSMITFGAGGYLAGSFIDRRGARTVIPVGAAILSFGLFLSSFISALWQLYLVFGVVTALGVTCIGYIPSSVVISSWFKENRATAIGTAFAGRGVGAVFIFPLIQYLITAYGWRRAYLFLAALILCTIFPLNLIFQRNHSACAKRREPAEESNQHSSALISAVFTTRSDLAMAPRWDLRQALNSGKFWLLFIAGVSSGISFSVVMVHQVAHVVGAGFSKMQAASAFGGIGLVRSFGGVMGGRLSDKFGREKAYAISAAFSSAGLLSLIWLPGAPYALLLWLYVLLHGLGSGSSGTISASSEADIFHGARFGSILGLMHMGTGLGGSVGPWLGGYIFDTARSYTYAFILVLILTWVSCFCIWRACPSGANQIRNHSVLPWPDSRPDNRK